MGKRILSLCMALALCLGLLPATALAADIEGWEDISVPETSGEWTSEGNYDVSWYTSAGEGKTAFTLENAADLAGLAVIVNGLYEVTGEEDWGVEATMGGSLEAGDKLQDNFQGKTITLESNTDFNLSGKAWTPIDGFAGTFDGNNATISGMVIESDSSSGLFSEIRSGATVKDLKIENAYIVVQMPGYEVYPTTSVGGLVGTNAGGTIQRCTFSGTIITDAYNIGGIAGRCTETNSKVETCVNKGTLESKRESTHTAYGVGGIVGLLHTGTVSNCTNNGTVTGYIGNPVGGVVGKMWDGTVSSCRNTAAVQGQEYSEYGIGGIVGDISMSGSSKFVEITDCHNSGSVLLSAGKQRQIGGIVGKTSGASIEISQCSNTGKISSTQSGNSLKLGGLVGSTGGVLTLTQSYNVGSVDIPSSTGYAGGLIGEATRPTSLQVENCYNVGAVTGGTVGGLIGRLYATDSSGRTVSISSSYNTGTVNNGKGNAMVGQTSTYVTLTVADNCTYLDTSGTGGLGKSQTANQMTDDTDWITHLGLDSSTWEKTSNPTSVEDSNGNWMGNLPVLTANKQDPAPQIQRTQKQDQPGFAITNEPTPTDTIYIDSTGFQLGTTGGAEGLSVTWSSSDDKVATVDSNGKVTIKGVGEVTITAQKAGNDSYNEASDAYTFTVYGRPITEVTILNLEAPVQGASPSQNVSVPEGDPYEALTSAGIGGPSTLQVTWREQGSGNVITTAFEQDKVYTVTMALKCDDYYSFDDSVTVHLSNMLESAYQKITAEKDTENGHENYLIITVTFNPTSHVHNWATEWSSNATHHWHACTAEDCPLKAPQGMCSYTQHTDTDNNGTCDICEGIIGYLITFNPNGGVCEIQNTRTDVNGALSSLPTPTRSGYTFLGWYTEDGTQVGEDTVFTQDTTLTAQWQYNAPPANPNYKITIEDTEHGTVTAPTSAKQGTEVTLTPTPDAGFEVADVTVTDRFGDAVEVTENPDGTYTFTMPNGQVTVEVTFVESQPEPLPFTDVAESDWFYDAVRYAYENGLMGGVGDNLFAPNNPTTRAQLVTILYRLEGEPAVTGQSPFTDVEADTWYTDAVTWAAEEGVVNGVSATQFAPGNNITREQLATILFRYAQAKGYDVSARADLSGFPDAGDILPYAQEAMAWAVAEGLLQGFEDDTLRPQGNATRAQIATILMRFCEGVVE